MFFQVWPRFFNLLHNLLRLPFWPLWMGYRFANMPAQRWVNVRVRHGLTDVDRPVPFFVRFVPALERNRPTSLRRLRELVDYLEADRKIEGVLIELPFMAAGWASLVTFRAELARLKEAGKKLVVWLPDGGSNRELYVASIADRILTTPQASIVPIGIAASVRYMKGALDRLGVELDVYRRAEFKTAMEGFASDSMSEAQREQLGALLDAFDASLVKAIAERKGFSEEKVRALFEDAIVQGTAAKEAGIVDDVCYEDQVPDRLGEPDAPKLVDAGRYLSYRASHFFRSIVPQPAIAIVPVHGTIVMGERGMAAQKPLVDLLKELVDDPLILGVVLHIDSPGGSAQASDIIHHEVERLAEKKPVVACFGDVAASGGYYIAAPAHAIVAQPLTITGSIGVVSARVVAERLFERIGVKTEVLRRAPHADLISNLRPLDDGEHAIFEREVDASYRAFVAVVAKGRKRAVADIEPLARGRVWSGRDAVDRGLVDVLGGLETAVDEVRARISYLPRSIAKIVMPRVYWPRSAEAPIPILAMARATLGIAIEPELADLLNLAKGRERVLCYAARLPSID